MAIGYKTKPSDATSDADFLAILKFDSDAPPRLRKAAKKRDITKFVLAYRAWLEPAASRFRKGLRCSLLQFVASIEPTEFASMIGEHVGKQQPLKCGLGRAITAWLKSRRPQSLSVADQLLAMEVLINPPIDIDIESWCRIWRLVLTSPVTPALSRSKSTLPIPVETEATFVRSLFFAPFRDAARPYKQAAASIESNLLAATDTDGTPTAIALDHLGEWLCPFIKCGWWGRSFRRPAFGAEGLVRFKALTKRATELCRADGSFSQQPAGTNAVGRKILPLAAKLAGFGKKTTVGRFVEFATDKKAKAKSESQVSSQSDWAKIGILRSHPRRKSDLAVVRFDGSVPVMELCSFGKPLISGAWSSKLSSANRVVNFKEWTCSCWYSDEDGDYIEIESRSGRARLERSVYLSRSDHFAVITDCVRAANSRPFQYEMRLPLAQDVMSRADFVSREWRLHTGNIPARVFPVCLEFDRVQNANGACTVRDETLVLNVDGETGTTASLVIDWHRKRTELPAEWNRLTVTEDRKPVAMSDAAAFRLRIGEKHQIVSYRNTSDSKELRAVLGQHTNRETTLGLLDKSGVFEPLVLVDA